MRKAKISRKLIISQIFANFDISPDNVVDLQQTTSPLKFFLPVRGRINSHRDGEGSRRVHRGVQHRLAVPRGEQSLAGRDLPHASGAIG